MLFVVERKGMLFTREVMTFTNLFECLHMARKMCKGQPEAWKFVWATPRK